MNISYMVPDGINGISVYANRLLAQLEKIGVQKNITFIKVTTPSPFLIHHNLQKFQYARRAYAQAGKAMNHADIAHIQYESGLFCVWTNPLEFMYQRFRKQIVIPVVMTVHELEKRKQSKKLITKIIKFFYYIFLKNYLDYVHRRIFMACDALLVHTKGAYEELVERGIPKEKIHLVVHGVPDVSESNYSQQEDKSYFHVGNSFVLMTYGYVTYRKGQDLVIDILDKLPENVVYLIAGSTDDIAYKEELDRLIQQKHLEKRVFFTGIVPEDVVNRLMHATDILIYPGREITASGVINEAIAYHKSVIGSALPFIQEINRVIPCIKTFPNEDKEELLQAIKEEMINPNKVFVENTKIYAREYSYASAAKKVMLVYTKLAKQKSIAK